MSESIFETFTDERGNISVRVSRDVQVLTREESRHIEAEYKRMQAENVKLRELCAGLLTGYECGYGELCDGCSWNGLEGDCAARTKARELGVEVDA